VYGGPAGGVQVLEGPVGDGQGQAAGLVLTHNTQLIRPLTASKPVGQDTGGWRVGVGVGGVGGGVSGCEGQRGDERKVT